MLRVEETVDSAASCPLDSEPAGIASLIARRVPSQRSADPSVRRGRGLRHCSLAPGAFALVITLIATAFGCATLEGQATTALDLRTGRHLFIDDFLIAEVAGLHRVFHEPRKWPEPVLGALDTPASNAQPYVSVKVDEGGRFRLWHDARLEPSEMSLMQWDSLDGISWANPREVLRFNGYGASIVDEGEESRDRTRRFKLAYWENLDLELRYNLSKRSGLCVAFSEDGSKWLKYSGNPVLQENWELSPENDPDRIGDPRWKNSLADIIDVAWDPIRQHFVIAGKSWTQPPEEFGPVSGSYEFGRRLISQTTSTDFIDWSKPRRIIVPEQTDVGDIEFYGMKIVSRGNQLLGFVRVLRDDVDDGIGYTVLAISNDGRTWKRLRQRFLGRSHAESNAWDHAVAWVGDVVTVEDQEFVYYGGYQLGHKAFGDRAIGIAFMRRDGFASMEADPLRQGRLLTKPFVLNATSITVNAAVRGQMQAFLRDADGGIVPGFAQGVTIRGDSVAHDVSWERPLEDLVGATVRLEFRLRGASLFGFALVSPRELE